MKIDGMRKAFEGIDSEVEVFVETSKKKYPIDKILVQTEVGDVATTTVAIKVKTAKKEQKDD